jgi:primosomal protein N' (replication factor Y)
MDLDTTSKRGAHRRILEEFGRGEIDVLLGTQMVAKGHDFPGVTLVGVVNADAGLSLPDFRAAERTFQLLAQVAGRAGRGEQPGDVYVQTLCPDHDALRLAAEQDHAGFYERESALRRRLFYPPFARLVAITGLGPDRPVLHQAMGEIEKHLRRAAHRAAPGATSSGAGRQAAASSIAGVVLGPAPCPIPRLRGRYREQILYKGAMEDAGKRDLQRFLAELARNSPGIEFQVDVDPVHML